MSKSVVVVKFQENPYKEYHFFTEFDHTVGQKVVVDTVNGLQVAVVAAVRVDSQGDTKATKWVVDVVDIGNIKRHVDRQETERRVKEIKAEMLKRRKKLEDVEVYELLASKDTGMRRLLEELNSLKGAE